MEVYYERLLKLAYSFQHKTINSFLVVVFKSGLQSYLCVATSMKKKTLHQHKEATLVVKKEFLK